MEKIKFDKSWLLFLAAAAIFLVIKIHSAHYAVSDENTYYKMGELVANGEVPYRDFFFAHTPLQIYLYAAVFMLFGFNLLLLKLLSAAAVIIAAAFIFAIVKEKLNSGIAAAAAALFLFSYGTLLFSNFPTGVEIAIAFATASFYFFMRKRFFASGFFSGLAVATAQLSIVAFAIMAAAALLLLKDKKVAYRLLLGFAASAGTISLAFLAVAKGEFIRQVIIYHFNKPSESADKAAIFLRIVKTNWLLFIAAAAAAVSRYRAKVSALFPLAIAAAYLAAFPLMKSSFNYYALYAFPFLAIAGGYGIFFLYEILVERLKLRQGMAVAAISAVVILGGFTAVRQFNSYDFQDFPIANDVAAYVRENSIEGQAIFGDDSTAPLASLLSGREIALNYVDNNDMRYQSGATDLGATLQLLQGAISKKVLKFVLLRRTEVQKGAYLDFGIGTEERFMGFVSNNCKLAKEFQYSWRGLPQLYYIYDCLKT